MSIHQIFPTSGRTQLRDDKVSIYDLIILKTHPNLNPNDCMAVLFAYFSETKKYFKVNNTNNFQEFIDCLSTFYASSLTMGKGFEQIS